MGKREGGDAEGLEWGRMLVRALRGGCVDLCKQYCKEGKSTQLLNWNDHFCLLYALLPVLGSSHPLLAHT